MPRLPDLEAPMALKQQHQYHPYSESDRTLRQVTVCLFLPALGFLLAHGIVAGEVCPALGLVPLFLSALTGLAHLFLLGTVRKFVVVAIAVDLFIAAFQLGVLIPSWIILSQWRYWNRTSSSIVVGTYGTTFLMVDLAIHAFFFLRAVHWPSIVSRMWKCPHCGGGAMGRYTAVLDDDENDGDNDQRQTIGIVENAISTDKPASPALSEYRDAQPISDDETARLL